MFKKRKLIRLKKYNYNQPNAYYVTMCVNNRRCLFGDVYNKKMILNRYGAIIDKCWNEIPDHFSHVQLDKHIVIPNHIHGIIIIGKRVDSLSGEYIETLRRGTACRAPTNPIEYFGKPVPGSLSTIMRSFKSAATKQINQLRNTPKKSVWQRNYYEHIIRNQSDLNRIRHYILNNPLNWKNDKYYTR
jgi:putative transposase